MAMCEYCGEELRANAKFCEHCGVSLAKTDNEQEQVDSVSVTENSYQEPELSTTQQDNFEQSESQKGSYQEPVKQTSQQTATKQKKPVNKKIFIFGGIAIAAVVAIVVIGIIFFGGGKDKIDSDSPYIGAWSPVTVEMFGETFPGDEILGSMNLQFKEDGKCLFQTDEGSHSYKWEESEKEILILSGSDTIITCVKIGEGLEVEDYLNTGMKIIFEKEGAKPSGSKDGVRPSGSGDTGSQNSGLPDINLGDTDSAGGIQEKWNGSWYGYLYLVEAFGEWEEHEDGIYDAYMVIDVDEGGNGTMAIFLEDEEIQTVDSYILADEDHFEVTEGEFWDYELDPSQWWLGTSPVDDGNLIVISDTYIDPELTENDGFEYIFQFRPWGELWEQEENEVNEGKPGSKLPPGYDDYITAIRSGTEDPNAFKGSSNNQPNGGTSDDNSADIEGIAGLPGAEFSGEVESFTEGGVSIHYPQGLRAAIGTYGGVSVTLSDECKVTAIIESQAFSFEDMLTSLESYLEYKDAQLYNSIYNGYDCVVLIYDKDDEHIADATITIYVYIEDGKQVRINGSKWAGTLDEMMQNHDFLAIMQNITW